MMKNRNVLVGIFTLILFIISLSVAYDYVSKRHKVSSELALKNHVEKAVKWSLNATFKDKESSWPNTYADDDTNLKLVYTFNNKLSNYVKRLLKRYRSDYSAVIIIDNETGKILSAIGHERVGNKFTNTLPFSSTHPSASLFKIITSAALLENNSVDKDTVFNYRGKGTTLYKYQLRPKNTRWTRYLSLKNAFAFSNNVIFGKAAINHLGGDKLFKQALQFGFNTDMMKELTLSKSFVDLPSSQYNLAEIASGFNKETMISPIHGAMLASIIANDGVVKKPYIVDKVINSTDGKNVWRREEDSLRAIGAKTSKQLKEMMVATVKKGTARSSFRKLSRTLKNYLSIGGKTGSITGGLPFGKRDWFTVFAVPKNKVNGKGISICVMNVNVNKWYVKSTFLAKSIIEYYYKEISPKKAKSTTTKVVTLKMNKIEKV